MTSSSYDKERDNMCENGKEIIGRLGVDTLTEPAMQVMIKELAKIEGKSLSIYISGSGDVHIDVSPYPFGNSDEEEK